LTRSTHDSRTTGFGVSRPASGFGEGRLTERTPVARP
jgi:hypothetical protein